MMYIQTDVIPTKQAYDQAFATEQIQPQDIEAFLVVKKSF
jgi:hypothetical protein